MDYLKKLFDDELYNEGEVDIRGNIFYKNDILLNLDEVAYNNTFEEWKKDRQENLLSRAEEIKKLYDNSDRLDKLCEIFSSNKIIPFVGAGLSSKSGLKLWKDFLLQIKKGVSVDESLFNDLIEQGEYEEVGQLLCDADEDYLQEQISNHFGKIFNIDDIYGVIRRLPELFDQSVITTNYDDLLKIVYEENGKSFHYEMNGLDAEEFGSLLNQGRNVLLKLHGTYTSRNKRVLTRSDYERHYNENNTISKCIERLFSQSLLFLGCSLNTDRTIKEMAEFVKKKGTDSLPKHYAFLSSNELSDQDRIEKRKLLQKSNIYPIWYDGEHDEDIEALLEYLLKIKVAN